MNSFKEHISYKIKPNDNKQNYLNRAKDYQDEQESLAVRGSDSTQVRQLKNKLKTVMLKFANSKKQKEVLQKENKHLQEEVLTLQNNLRQMVSGFANTSSSFPVPNQLAAKIAQFYKYDCLDKFFDLLGTEELSMKGIIYFYMECFRKPQQIIIKYMQPAFISLQAVGCFESLDGPIMNVLRKAFQGTYKKIIERVVSTGQLQFVAKNIMAKLQMTETPQRTDEICQFLKKICELQMCCMICDPPLIINIDEIGKKVIYNSLKHDPLDGFIKSKEECWIVLPEVTKSIDRGDPITKSLVLQVNYDDLIN